MSYPFHRRLADASPWAMRVFGNAELGDKRLRDRLVEVATGVAQRPAGRITQVFSTDADRQGAYGLLENTACKTAQFQHAMGRSAAVQATEAGLHSVYVAIDGSSVRVRDPHCTKGTGRVGSAKKKGRGFEVMSALHITPDGVPLALGGQIYWARTEAPRRKSHKKRAIGQKETRFWLEMMSQQVDHFERARQGDRLAVRLHFLMDRGADARHVLVHAVALRDKADTTVRVAHNRRVDDPQTKYLRDQLARSPAVCSYALEVPAGRNRTARTAHMEVRFCTATLILRDPWTNKTSSVTLNAVMTREIDTTPKGEKPIEWLLYTTCAVQNAEQACAIIAAYAFRWRIEEFHRAWKSGLCCVQDTELRSAEAITKWATILAAVAARAVHLSYASRNTPEVSARDEYTDEEIDAAIVLRRPDGYHLGDRPALHIVTRWVADLGGYVGKSSGGPPGPTVIGRGLREVTAAVRTLANLRELQCKTEM